MIASLHGIVIEIGSGHLVVEVGGIGLRVLVPASVRENLDGVGRGVRLYTHLIVREDSLTLYGFSGEDDRSTFELLLGVNGIGPRSALSILSTVSPVDLRRAVTMEQPEFFTRVPGIGKKIAEKLVFHLRDKLGPAALPGRVTAISETDTEVIAALTTLGYSLAEAQAALQAIPKDAPGDVETRVRLALQSLGS